jgi:hypothetical protein
MKILALALLALPLAIWGCASRNHLTPEHGRAYREAMARQAVNPEAGKRGPVPKGLDPQEAAVIAAGYKASIAPKGGQVQPEPTLLIAPSVQRGGSRPGDYLPPASVPQER